MKKIYSLLVVSALMGVGFMFAPVADSLGQEVTANGKSAKELAKARGFKSKVTGKLDIDADLNYDGVISNTDPGDGGSYESAPPGLQLGVGELSKVVIRLRAHEGVRSGKFVLRLEVAGINRVNKSGEFGSFSEEKASTGRVRVWSDASKSKLLLDSADIDKRAVEWVAEAASYSSSDSAFPEFVYVEGLSTSEYPGDIRLLIRFLHEEGNGGKLLSRSLKELFDHILFTVRKDPFPKELTEDSGPVWVSSSN